jgi:outer membrane lipoprotein carrier protein
VLQSALIRRSLALLVAVGAVAISNPAPAEQIDLTPDAEGLERLRGYLDDLQALRANFRQEVTNGNLELIEVASGRVVLQKPGRFRWDYLEPFERVIVADGERVWLYEADLQQVTVRTFNAGLGETPAALLTGDTEVLKQFDYLGSRTDEGIDWMRLKPRSAESDFENITLGFDAGNLVQIALADKLGQQTRVYLTQIERPATISGDVFRFEVPEGVDVIGETEL